MTPEEKKEKQKIYYLLNREKIIARQTEYKQNNKDKRKVNRELNKEKINNQKKIFYENNKEKILEAQKEYYENNKEERIKYSKIYNLINKEKNKEKLKIYYQNKWKNNPTYRLKSNVSRRIRYSLTINGLTKKNKTSDILGCSLEDFKSYIESKFESWMTWENMGNPKDGILEINKTWDIDHIIPISSAKTESDILKLNHHSNLQPLCSYTNRFIKK